MHNRFFPIHGLLPIFILKLISERGEMYGYEIINEIQKKTGCWKPSPGTIYPLLERMEKKGLIKKCGNGKKKIKYKITKKGKAKILKINRLRRMWVSNLWKFKDVFGQIFKTENASMKTNMLLFEISSMIKEIDKKKMVKAEAILESTKNKIEELKNEK